MEMRAGNAWEEVNNLLYYTQLCCILASGLRLLMAEDKYMANTHTEARSSEKTSSTAVK